MMKTTAQAHRRENLDNTQPSRGKPWYNRRHAAALALLVLLFGVSCTSTPPRTLPSSSAGTADIGAQRSRVVEIASAQIGIPYRYGGSSPRGFDCSGLVQFAHAGAGVDVPRTTRDQWRQGRRVAPRQLTPGDLLFFELGWRKSRHVGVYVGEGGFVHAPSSGKHVSYASLDDSYWQAHFAGARSFLPAL